MSTNFETTVAEHFVEGLTCSGISTLQVNVGFRCNQRCTHCHVGAAPGRPEVMEWGTMERVLDAAEEVRPELVDITGGAPELNPEFRRFVVSLKADGYKVQVRTNLTVLLESGCEDLPDFLRRHNVRLAASMPCYLEENVDSQRGSGAYRKSIEAMRRLNALGYGMPGGPKLDLVYNPGGTFLPPTQAKLEDDYRRELDTRFGLKFSHLLTITNMPLGRFWEDAKRDNKDEDYMRLLTGSFNPGTLDGLMCRHQICVGWDGRLYDCDFNLAIGLPVGMDEPETVYDFDALRMSRRRIITGPHCYGCTAGCGSSCKGALV